MKISIISCLLIILLQISLCLSNDDSDQKPGATLLPQLLQHNHLQGSEPGKDKSSEGHMRENALPVMGARRLLLNGARGAIAGGGGGGTNTGAGGNSLRPKKNNSTSVRVSHSYLFRCIASLLVSCFIILYA